MRKLSIWGALQNLVGAKIGPKIDQVAPKNFKKTSMHLTIWGPGTDLFPESIRIEVFMICCKLMIDLGPLICIFFLN